MLYSANMTYASVEVHARALVYTFSCACLFANLGCAEPTRTVGGDRRAVVTKKVDSSGGLGAILRERIPLEVKFIEQVVDEDTTDPSKGSLLYRQLFALIGKTAGEFRQLLCETQLTWVVHRYPREMFPHNAERGVGRAGGGDIEPLVWDCNGKVLSVSNLTRYFHSYRTIRILDKDIHKPTIDVVLYVYLRTTVDRSSGGTARIALLKYEYAAEKWKLKRSHLFE